MARITQLKPALPSSPTNSSHYLNPELGRLGDSGEAYRR